jgi:hypothetical protein
MLVDFGLDRPGGQDQFQIWVPQAGTVEEQVLVASRVSYGWSRDQPYESVAHTGGYLFLKTFEWRLCTSTGRHGHGSLLHASASGDQSPGMLEVTGSNPARSRLAEATPDVKTRTTKGLSTDEAHQKCAAMPLRQGIGPQFFSWQLGPGTSIAGASVRAHHRGGRREVGIMHLQCGLLGAREHCTHCRLVYSPYAFKTLKLLRLPVSNDN